MSHKWKTKFEPGKRVARLSGQSGIITELHICYPSGEDMDYWGKALPKIADNKYQFTSYTVKFDDGKISDHSSIFYTINNVNIASLNLLDDSYTILTMFFQQLPYEFKQLYTYALTIALNNIIQQRMTKIVELLVHANPEIICFQEANLEMLEILIKQLAEHGFNMHNKNEVLDTYLHKGLPVHRNNIELFFIKRK